MITAEEARKRIINLEKKPEVFDHILKKIESRIIEACDKRLNCMTIFISNKDEISQLEFVIEELKKCGYIIKSIEVASHDFYSLDVFNLGYIYELTISW